MTSTASFICAVALTQLLLAGNATKVCKRPNEVYACGGACQVTCENYNKTCDIVNVKCNDWCYCKENYARDQTSTCVPIKKCADRLKGVCGANEQYRLGFYRNNECARQLLLTEVDSRKLKWGCYCRNGFLRDSNGNCRLRKYCRRNASG